jgi:phthiocerol/phenolphthiocerol synthesis type-I polyketide synthase C
LCLRGRTLEHWQEVVFLMRPVAIVGLSSRLPGADAPGDFWRLLVGRRNMLSDAPRGRWNIERFLRKGAPAPGFSYSFAGGYLEDPLLFDPAPFGISPREVQQIDPQQRLLLELVWQAFEDASISPADARGGDVGVFVGASTVDHMSAAIQDLAGMESHFMTGNSLSILANRISYVFDLRGPSLTIDTACSSSLVAMSQAIAALESGVIDTAVVAGVNLLLSPVPFIGFSQARMLSPTGRSRPFSRSADGYVRAEGGVVLLLRRLDDAVSRGDRIRSVVLGVDVNADGRTNGISMPSVERQKAVIGSIYKKLAISPDDLAFVEAHGTGTPVGDPVEATAIGEALGVHRSRPLPIGSAKSNVGHLEAASGLVGLLKASFALEHKLYPASLYGDDPTDAVDLAGLNLEVAQDHLPLGSDGVELVAGVCNYGFGGVNAHAVLRAPRPHEAVDERGSRAPFLLVTAATRDALVARAEQMADELVAGRDAPELGSALAWSQQHLVHRLALPVTSGDPERRLRSYAAGGEASAVATAVRHGGPAEVTFVFSGNGCQFTEMGKAAFAADGSFRGHIKEIDALFAPAAGWSLEALLRGNLDAEVLARTSIAQPLIYAIQSALVGVLQEYGVRPQAVLGHSVGEVAAAEACGALSRRDAVDLILVRSLQQERARGLGGMMVVAADEATVISELAIAGASAVEIAALNSPGSITVAGPRDKLDHFAAHCRSRRIATILLEIDYPFHSSTLDPLRDDMVQALAGLSPQSGHTTFISSVEGGVASGDSLGSEYWWRNLRQPVRFQDALLTASGLGANLFLEISPRPILHGAILDSVHAGGSEASVLATLSPSDRSDLNPCAEVIARLVAHGADIEPERVFGPRPRRAAPVPPYPFQRARFMLPQTSEALRGFGFLGSEVHHPLLGARSAASSMEWKGYADAELAPYLTDHRVDGVVVTPAATLIEMALTVGAEVFGAVPLELDEFDVVRALSLAPGETREVVTRWSESTGVIEIRSRKRFSEGEWSLHARGLLSKCAHAVPAPPPEPQAPVVINSSDQIYAAARRAGLDYGPLFRIAEQVERDLYIGLTDLRAASGGLGAYEDRHAIHPVSLDAALHGLFVARPQVEGETIVHLPVRFRKIRLFLHGSAIRRSNTRLVRETDRSKTVALTLFGEDGAIALTVDAVVLRAVVLSKQTSADRTFARDLTLLSESPASALIAARSAASSFVETAAPPPHLLLRAIGLSLARRLVDAAPKGAPADKLVRDDGIAGYMGAVSHALQAYAQVIQSDSLQLPAPEALLATLLHSFPEAALEAQVAAYAIEQAPRLLAQRAPLEGGGLFRRWASADPLMRTAAERVAATLRSAASSAGRPLRILALEPLNGAVARELLQLGLEGSLDLTFAATSAESLADRRRAVPANTAIAYLDLARTGELAHAPYDVLVGGGAPQTVGPLEASLRAGLAHLNGGGLIVFAAARHDAAMDVLLGVHEPSAVNDQALQGGGPWSGIVAGLLRANQVQDVEICGPDEGFGQVIIGVAPQSSPQSCDDVVICVATDTVDAGTYGFDKATVVLPGAQSAELSNMVGRRPVHVYVLPVDRAGEPTERLAARIEDLSAVLNWARDAQPPAKVTVVTRGAGEGDPVEAGLLGFVRVAINEYPMVDLRVLDVANDADARQTAQVVAFAGGERELALTVGGLAARRVNRDVFPPHPLAADERSVLQFAAPGRLETLSWSRQPRRSPARHEIEVEVHAVGVNFRDVLLGLGILDDELLGAGLTGAALGFECAGIVVRVGEDVDTLAVGDHVMGLASGAFASHVTAPSAQFFRAPPGLSHEAAATIPVAFATAWHSLVERAGLKAGEEVLVHGGAGGLGMAATQIAKNLGARVLATAGNAARQSIARAAGADLIFESRGERFASAIAAATGGVDVALNSLAGSAMVATLRLVRPFGRFIEVGKRDYLDNTHLALRPFIRNITYAGVDLDELLAHDATAAGRIMNALSSRFASGELRPLPYTVYESHEVPAAFRTMQASEHVGKIVVRPPSSARFEPACEQFRLRPGAYLVVGGATGLGFETALWLAAKGATTVIIASRRGRLDPVNQQRLAEFQRAGVQFHIEPLDVTNAQQVSALVNRVEAGGEPLRGVVHAAVHLDDGLIAGLEADRLRAVLRVKVDGAVNLDRATRLSDLDFFLLYSSAAALVGSPGQGAYVAANSFLEGLATQRHQQGRPALAIGWGAISDVGLVARDQALGERLRRTTGVGAIASTDALTFLGRILSLGRSAAPVQYYANVVASAAAEKMTLLMSPMFGSFDLTNSGGGGGEDQDLASLVEGKAASEALTIVTEALRREIAKILHMPEADIDRDRALADLGFDSLMALELQLTVERLCGMQLPLVGTSERSLAGLASALLERLMERTKADDVHAPASSAAWPTQERTRESMAKVDEAAHG